MKTSQRVVTNMSRLFLIVAIFFANVGQLHAGVILYYVDSVIGNDFLLQALEKRQSEGHDTFLQVNSVSDFQTELETGNYDLGIFMAQAFGAAGYQEAINSLGTFVAGGGRALYADWSKDDALSAQFGATFSGSENEISLTVDPLLASGLTSNTLGLNPNLGWAAFSTGLIGTTAATFADGSGAIVIGNGGRSIVNGFLTDTFTNDVDGVQLYENEIAFLTITAVPEPTSLACFGVIFIGLVCRSACQSKKRKET